MSTPVQNEIIKTKEESQARTSHAIRQEMNIYRGMILNYVWTQTNWQCYERHLKSLAVYSRPLEPCDTKPDSRTQSSVLCCTEPGELMVLTVWLSDWHGSKTTDIPVAAWSAPCILAVRLCSYVIRALIGSQYRAARSGAMLSNYAVHITARASEFWSLWSLSMLDFEVPYKILLQ